MIVDLKSFLLSSPSISFKVIDIFFLLILLPQITLPLTTFSHLSSTRFPFLIILTILPRVLDLGELIPFLIMPFGW